MFYTVRFTHLREKPKHDPGEVLLEGDVIGIMGSSGASTAAHLHIDCVEGVVAEVYHLKDMENRRYLAAGRQLCYFLDDGLFGIKPIITTPFNCPDYLNLFGKLHQAYDVVPEDRHKSDEHYSILWNRTKAGRVVSKGFHAAYGNYINIVFEA